MKKSTGSYTYMTHLPTSYSRLSTQGLVGPSGSLNVSASTAHCLVSGLLCTCSHWNQQPSQRRQKLSDYEMARILPRSEISWNSNFKSSLLE